MLVHRDGTVEFTWSHSSTLEPSGGGFTSMNMMLGIVQQASSARLDLSASLTLDPAAQVELGQALRKFDLGFIIYPNATRVLFDVRVEMATFGFPYELSDIGETIYFTRFTARGEVNDQVTELTGFLTIQTVLPYTSQELNDYITDNQADIIDYATSAISQLGLQVQTLEISAQVLSPNVSQVRIDVRLLGDLSALLTEFTGGVPTQPTFSPYMILGVFIAPPNDLSRATVNLTEAGTIAMALTFNYRGNYDDMVNANRMNYLNNIESIAMQDLANGQDWLPLIDVLKPAQLTVSPTRFTLNIDATKSTMTLDGRSPKMRVGQVSGNSISLTNFISSLAPLDSYFMDKTGNPTLKVAIRGVEDASSTLDIVIPSGAPTPTSRNASTAVWEGVWIEQLQDVSFVIRPKDSVAPTITPSISPGATLSEARPTLSAVLSDNVAIDVSSIVIKVDGVDVTSSATTSASSVSYKPTTDLQEGQHTLYVSVRDTAGNPAEVTVSFSVSLGIPMVYLIGGGAAVVIVVAVIAYFLFLKKPSAPVSGQPLPPPPPPA
jgi:hypothetical protein